MAALLSCLAVVALLGLAISWIASGLVGIYRWCRGDHRVPRARLRGGRPRLRPGLGEPVMHLLMGGGVIGVFAWVLWATFVAFRSYGSGC